MSRGCGQRLRQRCFMRRGGGARGAGASWRGAKERERDLLWQHKVPQVEQMDVS